MAFGDSGGPVTALLGPTNTGKTHRAVQRMLDHRSGMIGLPLRLLAREVYDRVSAAVGEESVALVTGEEKRVPARPRYWVCTVESMPIDRPVDFLAVDEIQLAAHRRRGHVFTDRLLHARGAIETWFLGAATIAPILKEMLPHARIDARPRFSTLSYAGSHELSALPPRTAVVAFSAAQVYELAERLRRRRGGTAVVLGALSPRTRNAQVAMYQAGEVHYMVATDAIGMGLNMDVDHVAFASLTKFDGRESRALAVDEIAQIAGRAGRYQRDGTFGTLAEVGPLPPPIAGAVENHAFPPLAHLVWRSVELDYASIDALIASLRRSPPRPGLRRIEQADDFAALLRLADRPEIRRRATTPEAIALLWDVCRIPDFRRLPDGSHHRLLAVLYEQLSGPRRRVDPKWMADRIARLAIQDGDIDTLITRIAFIRTWTYVSHHPRWVVDAERWQERTQAIESDLSDALHLGLTQRFVLRRDRGAAVPVPRDREEFSAQNPFRGLAGLDLPGAEATPATPVDELEAFAARLADADARAIDLDAHGRLRFEGALVGHLGRGPELLRPEVILRLDDRLGGGARTRVHRRLRAALRDQVAALLGPLDDPAPAGASPALRGLLYQLRRGLGAVLRRDVDPQLGALQGAERRGLEALGIRVGDPFVLAEATLAPAALRRRAALLVAERGATSKVAALIDALAVDEAPRPAIDLGVEGLADVDPALVHLAGYARLGAHALRIDLAESVAAELHRRARRSGRGFPLIAPDDLAERLACAPAKVPAALRALGFDVDEDGDIWLRLPPRGRRRPPRRRR
ncbi:MAG: helicase-related protein [Nannocystaceae bacterium]